MSVDLSDPATIQDPDPAYAWLREHAPVHRWELDAHLGAGCGWSAGTPTHGR